MTPENGWTLDRATEIVGIEPPGPPLPKGIFARAKRGVERYEFSDPALARPHFDRNAKVPGRDMAVEISFFGMHFLAGVRVCGVEERQTETETVYGFRYETLEGHPECGHEMVLLHKKSRDRRSGLYD